MKHILYPHLCYKSTGHNSNIFREILCIRLALIEARQPGPKNPFLCPWGRVAVSCGRVVRVGRTRTFWRLDQTHPVVLSHINKKSGFPLSSVLQYWQTNKRPKTSKPVYFNKFIIYINITFCNTNSWKQQLFSKFVISSWQIEDSLIKTPECWCHRTCSLTCEPETVRFVVGSR